MLIFIVISLMTLAILHFVYESALAPNERLLLRWRLFALRDRLRALKLDHDVDIDDEVYRVIEDYINNAVQCLHQIDPLDLHRAERRLEADPVAQKELALRVEKIRHCDVKEALDVLRAAFRITDRAMVVNCLGGVTFFYLPLALAVLPYLWVKGRLQNWLTTLKASSQSAVLFASQDRFGFWYPLI